MKANLWSFLGAERLSLERKRKLGTVALLYLIQGAPAAILWEVLPVYLRREGALAHTAACRTGMASTP